MTPLTPSVVDHPRAIHPDWRFLAEAIPHIVWMASPDGATTYFSQRWADYTGRTREATYGRSWLEFVHPDDAGQASESWEEAVWTGEPWEREYRIRRHDGMFRWQMGRAQPVRDASGVITEWIGTVTDIEDHKQLELSLRRSEREAAETLRVVEKIQAAAPVGFCFVDRDFRIVRINETLASVNGGAIEEQVGHTVAEVVPHLWPHIEGVYQRALAGQTISNMEVSGATAEDPDRPHHWLTSYYPVWVNGEIVGVGNVIVDITERKEAEGAHAFQARLLKAAGDAIIATDATGTIVYANEAAERIYRWPTGGMLGHPALDTLVADTPAHADDVMAQLNEGRSWSGEFTVKRQDGTRFPVAVTNTPIFDDDGELTAIIGVSSDITERKRAEEALRRNLDAMVETIASTVEHRDPYTAGHQWRVAELAGAIGRELGLDEFTIEGIEIAAKIHDLGKISVPSEILTKPTNLTAPELELIKQHAEIGYQIIEGIDFPWPVAEMVRQHHERMDGSGYPRALSGEEILLGARIIAIADTVEAMGAHRPYRPGRGLEAALNQIEQDRGTRLDADAVDACLRLFRSGRYWLEVPQGDVAQGRLALQ